MKFVYTTKTGWAINEQDDMFGSSVFYTVYRYYPTEKWVPFKLVGSSLALCFVWLCRNRFISTDEMTYQLKLLEGEKSEATSSV